MTTILVLDDEPDLRCLLGMVLACDGYRVITATDSQEALLGLRAVPVDLLIQDLVRPGMDGVEFYALLKADVVLKRMPVLFWTGGSLPGATDRKRRAFRDGLLQKPALLDDVVTTIERLLRQHRRSLPTLVERYMVQALQDILAGDRVCRQRPCVDCRQQEQAWRVSNQPKIVQPQGDRSP